jgi:predicted metal-dependent hydrolase
LNREEICDKKTYLEGIGTICLRRSSRARLIRLKIDHKDGVVVVLPNHIPEKYAIDFVGKKKGWIKKSLARQAELKSRYTIFTENTAFRTRNHILCIQKHNKATVKSAVSRNEIRIWYPDFANVEDDRIQKVIRRAVEETWRIEAKRYLPYRTQELALQHGFNYNHVRVKKASSRWGSCSSSNNINLNIQLMRLPDNLIDYVILHELAHTVQKNHQSSFWNLLEAILPGAKKLDKSLNKYNLNYW